MYSKRISILLVIAGLLAVLACKPALYVPGEEDATPSASLSDLQQGRRLYVQKCSGCHTLYLPEKYTPGEWQKSLVDMKSKVSISDAEMHLMHTYLSKGK